MRIIDVHTHAFPDSLAARAMQALKDDAEGATAYLDGTLGALLGSMDAAGIERAVVASIATKPEQFPSILRWSKAIASDRIIPFPSIHPADPQVAERVRELAAEGLQGLKLHPYYQGFDLDDPQLLPLYEAIQRSGLILLCHTGFDFAFPRVRRCDPARIVRLVEAFPELKLVTSHLGAWEDWEEVQKHLVGKPVYMETSFSFEPPHRERSREILLAHPQERLLFGTDSPWRSQAETIEAIRSLGLGAEREACLFFRNAERLLGLA